MNGRFDSNERISLLQKWYASEEYRLARQQMHEQYIRLLRLAEQFLPSLKALQRKVGENTVHWEYASGGSLHRGPYCPSPIRDYVVGNAKRGRVLKRVSGYNRVSHRFAFDQAGRMLLCEQFSQGNLIGTEYLVYDGLYRYGFQVSPSGYLIGITEECLIHGRLARYTFVQVQFVRNEYLCYNLHCEEYGYDETGLVSCKYEDYFPDLPGCQRYDLEFERQNGYLTAYTAVDRSIAIQDVMDCYSHRYTLKGDRKA